MVLGCTWFINCFINIFFYVAAFKIIKSLLPEKAIEKLKIVKKPGLKDWVPIEQQLECWGGTDPYVFSFVPENKPSVNQQTTDTGVSNNKKVFLFYKA